MPSRACIDSYGDYIKAHSNGRKGLKVDMGLDLVVEGCPKPGHEPEWRHLLERSFAGEKVSESEVARFREICIPGYERIGAPRVGYDDAANQWILQARNVKTPEEAAAVLKEFEGYYVVRLVECDGVPKYSHAGLHEGTIARILGERDIAARHASCADPSF